MSKQPKKNFLRDDITVEDEETTIKNLKKLLKVNLDPINGANLFIEIASLFDTEENLDLALKTANLKRVKK
ncbi:MAG: hypothetical protein KJ597_05860 [Nanoarchaeota archaeon]|nr:hypothetical protein [Nanoarchaeota archaeon]MBU1623071.1 hypothetical protein [Nanoarchaeota archaeon]